MAITIDDLTRDSSPTEARKAISTCISRMADEHPDWDNDRRVAACMDMAREAGATIPTPKVGGRTSRRITGIGG